MLRVGGPDGRREQHRGGRGRLVVKEEGAITSQRLPSTAGWTNGSRRVTQLTLLCHTLARGRVRSGVGQGLGLPRGVPHLGLARRRPLAFLPAALRRRAAPRRASLPLPLRQVTPRVRVRVRVRV